jgi:hypothetical protein
MKITEFEKGDLIRTGQSIGIVTKAEKSKYSVYWIRNKKTYSYSHVEISYFNFRLVATKKRLNV